MVEHYLKLEKEIWQFEAKNIVKNLQTKQQQLDSARKSWQQLQKHYTEVELELWVHSYLPFILRSERGFVLTL